MEIIRYMNTLSGAKFDWMLEDGFSAQDLIAYRYPDVKNLMKPVFKSFIWGGFWEIGLC